MGTTNNKLRTYSLILFILILNTAPSRVVGAFLFGMVLLSSQSYYSDGRLTTPTVRTLEGRTKKILTVAKLVAGSRLTEAP